MRTIFFGAGQALDSQGRQSSCWMGFVGYTWDAPKKVFHVQTETAIGTGSVYNYSSYKEEVKTCKELDKILHNMKWLENHYKKIYEN